jgi:hypothetical protein
LRRVVSQKLTDVSFQRSLLFPSSAPWYLPDYTAPISHKTAIFSFVIH